MIYRRVKNRPQSSRPSKRRRPGSGGSDDGKDGDQVSIKFIKARPFQDSIKFIKARPSYELIFFTYTVTEGLLDNRSESETQVVIGCNVASLVIKKHWLLLTFG